MELEILISGYGRTVVSNVPTVLMQLIRKFCPKHEPHYEVMFDSKFARDKLYIQRKYWFQM